jgi:hypothetical protein
VRALILLVVSTMAVVQSPAGQNTSAAAAAVEFIDTSIENGSPLFYDTKDGVVRVHLLYDHERASPNRAAGHIHFRVHAHAGARLTFEFLNLDNVWNGQPGSVARELRVMAISEDGRAWKAVPTESLPGNRVQLHVEMPGPVLYVARLEPYRLSDLDRFVASIHGHPLVQVVPIGRTAGARELHVIRIGSDAAPYHAFVRARAHPWEAGSSWVAQGLMQRLLDGSEPAARFLRVYSLSVLPMANKDGVARGGTRFNLRGTDLNRGWDRPADPRLAPENAALERWLERTIADGRRPHLAIELHNDGSGRLHISRPPVAALDRHLARMAIFEALLREKTWFTEGHTNSAFRNSGTLGDGWLQRYGIDAVVHELNANWSEGLKERPLGRHWTDYGAGLAEVLHDYFVRVEP